jgi:hypothetical protein
MGGSVSDNPVVYSTSFDTSADLQGWFRSFAGQIYATLTRDAAHKRTGTHSLRVDALWPYNGYDDGLGRAWYATVNCEEGQRYRLTAWVYLGEQCDAVRLSAFFDNAMGFDSTSAQGEWVQIAVEGTPTRTSGGDPFIQPEIIGVGEVGSFWVDDVVVYAVPGADEVVAPRRALDQILAGSAPIKARATLLSGPYAGETLPVTDGSITVGHDADVTRSGTLTVAGLSEWEPRDATDALDVRSGTEILLEQGVTDDDGIDHWWSQGIFRPSSPSVSRDSSGISITCAVHDRAYAVKLASIRRRWVIGAQQPILGAVIAAVREAAPWLPVDVDTTDDYPSGEDVVMVEYGGDLWAAARELALSMGRRLHVNRDGVLVAPHIVDPYTTDPSPLPPLLTLDTSSDTAQIVNVVGAAWTEAKPDDAPDDWVPDGGIEEWVDEESSTSIHSEVGVRARAYSGDASVLHTATHAAEAARADGLRLRDLSLAASCTVVPDPRLDVGGVTSLDAYILEREPDVITDVPASWGGVLVTWDGEPATWDTIATLGEWIGGPGPRFRVTSLQIDLSGLSPTQVTLGQPRPDLARIIGSALTPPKERQTIEVVTSTNPLRSRSIHDKGGSEASLRWTGAVSAVGIGWTVVVNHRGRGERVAMQRLGADPTL